MSSNFSSVASDSVSLGSSPGSPANLNKGLPFPASLCFFIIFFLFNRFIFKERQNTAIFARNPLIFCWFAHFRRVLKFVERRAEFIAYSSLVQFQKLRSRMQKKEVKDKHYHFFKRINTLCNGGGYNILSVKEKGYDYEKTSVVCRCFVVGMCAGYYRLSAL